MAPPFDVRADVALAERLFDDLHKETFDGAGITRVAYGQGEQAAHRLFGDCAAGLGLAVEHDFAGNSYATLAGSEPDAPQIIIGSHMDSVPQGGNFDGAAGVVAGLAAVAGLLQAGVKPRCDIRVMAVRAEESCWFPASYIGSRMALGRLPGDLVDSLRRSDTGRTLGEHMADLGFDPDAVRRGDRFFDPKGIACYLEPHIEQGPVLVERSLPLAIVEGITGGPRWRDAWIEGAHDHAGGAPRRSRQDSVAALGEFIVAVNRLWERLEAEGHFARFTFGIIGTDPEVHTFSRVPGYARFVLDTRAVDPGVLERIRGELALLIEAIEAQHRVRFHLGQDSGPSIAPMDPGIRAGLKAVAERLGLAVAEMPSGAGHDAAAFAAAGVSTGMIFIRNPNGSHNPHEVMEMADFGAAADLLANFLFERAA